MEPSTIQVEESTPTTVRICGKPVRAPSTVTPLEDYKKDKETEQDMERSWSSQDMERSWPNPSSVLVCGKPFSRSSSLLVTEEPKTSSTCSLTPEPTTSTTTTAVLLNSSNLVSEDFPPADPEQFTLSKMQATPCITFRNVNILESHRLSASQIEEKLVASEISAVNSIPPQPPQSQQEQAQPTQPQQEQVSQNAHVLSPQLVSSLIKELSQSQSSTGVSEKSARLGESTIVVHIHNHTHVWKNGLTTDSIAVVLFLVLVALVYQTL